MALNKAITSLTNLFTAGRQLNRTQQHIPHQNSTLRSETLYTMMVMMVMMAMMAMTAIIAMMAITKTISDRKMSEMMTMMKMMVPT